MIVNEQFINRMAEKQMAMMELLNAARVAENWFLHLHEDEFPASVVNSLRMAIRNVEGVLP